MDATRKKIVVWTEMIVANPVGYGISGLFSDFELNGLLGFLSLTRSQLRNLLSIARLNMANSLVSVFS
jgi:hypothetical protein